VLLNGLRQQLSYFPRIGSRLMCMLFECVHYIIQSCWKQGLRLDFRPDFEIHISSDWKLRYGCVSDSQTIDPARACNNDETLKAVTGNECGKLILTTEPTTSFVVSHHLARTSSHLSYFASQGWSKAGGERW